MAEEKEEETREEVVVEESGQNPEEPATQESEQAAEKEDEQSISFDDSVTFDDDEPASAPPAGSGSGDSGKISVSAEEYQSLVAIKGKYEELVNSPAVKLVSEMQNSGLDAVREIGKHLVNPNDMDDRSVFYTHHNNIAKDYNYTQDDIDALWDDFDAMKDHEKKTKMKDFRDSISKKQAEVLSKIQVKQQNPEEHPEYRFQVKAQEDFDSYLSGVVGKKFMGMTITPQIAEDIKETFGNPARYMRNESGEWKPKKLLLNVIVSNDKLLKTWLSETAKSTKLEARREAAETYHNASGKGRASGAVTTSSSASVEDLWEKRAKEQGLS